MTRPVAEGRCPRCGNWDTERRPDCSCESHHDDMLVYCHGQLLKVAFDWKADEGRFVPRCACGDWLPWYVW